VVTTESAGGDPTDSFHLPGAEDWLRRESVGAIRGPLGMAAPRLTMAV
jgi:hypothetical protein